jgi:hypothetical protein
MILAPMLLAGALLAGERPPECSAARVVNPDGTSLWLELCGSGPGIEQPLHNWAAGVTLLADGASVRGRGCGSRSAPCVLVVQEGGPPS